MLKTIALFGIFALGQVLAEECPEVTTIPIFESQKYLGDWYTVFGNLNQITDKTDNCIRASYRELNETFVYAKNVGYKGENVYNQVCGYAYQTNPEEEPGKLIVQFPGGPPGDYWILGTDYDSFACVYSCRKRAGKLYFFKWIITRDNNPSVETLEKGLEVYRANGLNTDDFVPFLQENCLYDNPDYPPCDE